MTKILSMSMFALSNGLSDFRVCKMLDKLFTGGFCEGRTRIGFCLVCFVSDELIVYFFVKHPRFPTQSSVQRTPTINNNHTWKVLWKCCKYQSCKEDSSKVLGGLCKGSFIEVEGCLILDPLFFSYFRRKQQAVLHGVE